MKTYMFPGQGSQSKGMGGLLFDEFPEIMNQADQTLGYSIKTLCHDDPDNLLNQTEYTQPALYVVSALSYYKAIKDNEAAPDYLIGHSLGEYNALLAAEAFDFETGLKLVKKRGELMANAAEGAMAAIVRVSQQDVEAVLAKCNLNDLVIANYNSPSQFVISGPKQAITEASDIFQAEKMKFIPLNTSGAFHSPQMERSQQEFAEYIKQFVFFDLKLPVISNIYARPYLPGKIISNLSQQITHAVKWTESICYLMAQGDMNFEEIGVGTVLTKLVKKIQKQAPPLKLEEKPR